MKILYINGTYEGGSLRSTRELLAQLPREDAVSRLILAQQPGRIDGYLRRRATNLAVKLGGHEPQNIVERMNRTLGRRATYLGSDEWSSSVVENAAAAFSASWNPDVVVVSSVDRVAWRRIRRDTADAGVPCVLYLREEALLAHLGLTAPPDLVLANSRGLVDSCKRLGFDAVLVPSVIDLGRCEIESERTTALLVNSTIAYGLERVIELAELCPNIDFVLQESTQMTTTDVDLTKSSCRQLGNLEFRPFRQNPADVYRDARVMLAPYTDSLESNRPRSVLESQWNGIPVVGTSRAGLRDAVGPGGVLLAPDAGMSEWVATLTALFESSDVYNDLVTKAREHSQRDEVDPVTIGALFIAALKGVVAAGS